MASASQFITVLTKWLGYVLADHYGSKPPGKKDNRALVVMLPLHQDPSTQHSDLCR